MALPSFAVTSDQELENAVRDKTSYNDAADGLPGGHDSGQMQGVIHDAKRILYMKTGSDGWYSDIAYGQALVALTAMKAKEAVENIEIASYGIGDESIRFANADPEKNQQIVSWSEEVNEGIDKAEINFEKGGTASFSNTASYLG